MDVGTHLFIRGNKGPFGDCGGHARGVGTELACQSGMECGDLVAREIANYLL